MTIQDELRKLPSVDHVLQDPAIASLRRTYGHDLVVAAARDALADLRQEIRAGQVNRGDAVAARTQAYVQAWVRPTLRPVINATGVILHTNLGRAPLSDSVLAAMRNVGQGYSNLEFDLEAGRRGSRYSHARALLCRLTGAESALVVNNNAGAVFLMLSALAKGREVIISRGQLVEIGGGFRIPDVMAQSGARLVEVGTTNRTYCKDYATAIGDDTAALLRVHSSNYRVIGFTHQPSLSDLVDTARTIGAQRGLSLLVLDDLGSGTLIDTSCFGMAREPMVQESVQDGADMTTFSGDKLLGGPQAGIILGKADLVEELSHHPLARALRVGKTTMAGIETNLLHYLKGEALTKIPIWRMISQSPEQIERRARDLVDELGATATRCELFDGRSMVGGGSLPGESLPTTLIGIRCEDAAALAAALRGASPAIIGRVQDGRVVLDLRTVLPGQMDALVGRLQELL